ncbi:hypothetical protein G6F65_010846 [Rhizopus arrhizus]|nr:hypothetical protein G6F65_010846 [Rhizopus arrhizus]
MTGPDAPFLRTLCSLRWLAVGGQAATILVATWVLGLPLPQLPLWAGVAVLALFNVYTQLRPEAADTAPLTAFGHILVDVIILTWMVGWSGGMANPFSSLFLILIALAAFALPLRWALAVALACLLGYASSGIFGQPLPDGYFRAQDLNRWGVVANFLISAAVVLAFSTRLALALRQRELELSALRERFARNEGIVALATHAASVAHELNTPLATMTLLADDVAERSEEPEVREDMETLRELLVQCRERVLALAAPASADAPGRSHSSAQQVLEQWRLVRPTIDLHRNDDAPLRLPLDPGVGHLLMVLLNNAADAGEKAGRPRVDLDLRIEGDDLIGEVRDYGHGFDARAAVLPGKLFGSSKSEGMGPRRLPPAAGPTRGHPMSLHHSTLGLLVDDDELYLRTLQRSLARKGLETQTAQDAASALALARQHPPAFALIDLKLGSDSGLALIQPLRALRADMRILLVTGYASIATAVEAIKLGADDYLPKPATAPMILRTLGLVKPESVTIETTMTPLHRLEWEHIHQALHETGGNVSAAARLLGMHRRSLQRKLAKKPGPEREVLVD